MQTKASEFEMNTATILANLTTTIFNYAEAVNQQMRAGKEANDKLVKENAELVKELDGYRPVDKEPDELTVEAKALIPVVKQVPPVKQED